MAEARPVPSPHSGLAPTSAVLLHTGKGENSTLVIKQKQMYGQPDTWAFI